MSIKMDNLFGSETRRSLLTALLMNQGRSYHIRELSEVTGVPYGMVYREVQNLTEMGLITHEKKGNLRILHVNKDLPIYPDLRNIIIKTTGFYTYLAKELNGGLDYLLVYGSTASNKDRPDGDIDLMVIGEIDEEHLLNAINRVEAQTKRAIDYIYWTTEEFHRKIKEGHHLLQDIADKPLIMLEGDEDEFRGTVKRRGNPGDQDK